MRKQRTLFLGKCPVRTPKKDGENRPVPERRRPPLDVRDIRIEFSNTTVTQFGGYPLWASFLDDLGVDARFAQHIKMNRGENGFTAPELSRFFLDSRVLGAERLVHVDAMRFDPMLVQAYGIDTLASDETLGRYFKEFAAGNLAALDHMNVWVNQSQWKWARRQGYRAMQEGKVIIDYDSSTSTVYGDQEGADRGRSFRKKDNPGFQAKFAFIGGLGILANLELYPQSYNLPKEFEPFHAATLAKLPKGARVWAIRGDGALYSEDRIERFEKRGYTYAISAWRTSHLHDAIIRIPEEAWEESWDEKEGPCSIARITYCPATWKKARTYIVSRRLIDLKGQTVMYEWQKYKYFAYVTNYRAPLKTQWQFSVERCSLENFIKESKRGFYYDLFPCQELSANQAYLGHVQMAYNLVIWWKLLRTPAGINRWTVATLRERVWNVCGNLVQKAGKWVLSLPVCWPWRTIYERLASIAGRASG